MSRYFIFSHRVKGDGSEGLISVNLVPEQLIYIFFWKQ